MLLLAKQAAAQVYGALFAPVLNSLQIRSDSYGDGHFGASRDGGARDHEGIDLVVVPGEVVYSPMDAVVVNRSVYPYSSDHSY